MKPYAFVIPWYGDHIRGGAESECNQLAHLFYKAGLPVEVLTTCVKEASDDRGKNTLKPGVCIESGIIVRRFPVKRQNMERLVPANMKLFHNKPVTIEEERAYLEEDINSPSMYQFIRENKDNYQYFIFLPYLYPPTYYGSMECPHNAVIIPCLHDEGYAYMSLLKKRMKTFKKMIFLSRPEEELANNLYDLSSVDTAVLGAYVNSGWEASTDPTQFKQKFHLNEPFMLCAGRKEPGKKTDLLLSYFCRYKEQHPLCNVKLVFIGGGKIDIPENHKTDVLDLGFVSLEDKYNAYAAAYCLCNPSHFESFSIVIMESWLAKRPVLVSEQCKVTTNFCVESNGGLWFNNYAVFEGCLDYLLQNESIANSMGENGYHFVQKNFVKDVILKKYMDFLPADVQ